LTNFNRGSNYSVGPSAISETSPILDTFTNEFLCSKFPQFYCDLGSYQNTKILTNKNSDNNCSPNAAISSGYAIPNIFTLMVIFYCSDIIDIMDHHYNDDITYMLGYTSKYGRFKINSKTSPASTNFLSSTETTSNNNLVVSSNGNLSYSAKTSYNSYIFVKELSFESRGFKCYRSDRSSDSNVIIEYNYPNSDGSLGERRKMELTPYDGNKYIKTSCSFASSEFNSNLTNLYDQISTGQPLPNIDNKYYVCDSSISRTTLIPQNCTNELLCQLWGSYLYNDLTATENTNEWISYTQCQGTLYAPGWARHVTKDDYTWSIPNLFQLMVIYCCSDILDRLTWASYGYYGFHRGRFVFSSTSPNYYVWSSTPCGSGGIAVISGSGYVYNSPKTSSAAVIPIHELD